jgi:hypothetical protein
MDALAVFCAACVRDLGGRMDGPAVHRVDNHAGAKTMTTPGFHKHQCACGYQWECGCDWPSAAPSCKPCEDAWFEAVMEYEESRIEEEYRVCRGAAPETRTMAGLGP